VGRKIQMTDENGNTPGATASDFTWTYEYDAEDGLRFTRAPPPTHGGSQLVTESRYDPERHLIASIDANGNIVRSTYDVRSQVNGAGSGGSWRISSTMPRNARMSNGLVRYARAPAARRRARGTRSQAARTRIVSRVTTRNWSS
jgi:hypothetical protein